MLNHELACDIEFSVGVNGDIVRAHKYMLVSRSPVFFAMFYGSVGTEHHNGPLSIPDTTVEAFRTMLQSVHSCTTRIMFHKSLVDLIRNLIINNGGIGHSL